MAYSSTAKSLNGCGIRYDPYYSTFIGIRNKVDGTMKLVEIEQMTVGANVKPPGKYKYTRNMFLNPTPVSCFLIS